MYMLKKRLAKAGFTVVIATDGKQGIVMATSERPDLIPMDLTLPDIRGEEATQRIKADATARQIPVIALTANAMAGDREKALAAGCDDFDSKPVEMSRLPNTPLRKSRATESPIASRVPSCCRCSFRQVGVQIRDTCVAGALRRDLRAGQRATRLARVALWRASPSLGVSIDCRIA